ncbi:isoprenyl transferase [Chloroflexota bacterium]
MPTPQTTKNIEHLPDHIAIVMDGNGRWARQRGLFRIKGHQAGARNIRPVIQCLNQYQIKYVTLFSFSAENWTRPQDEVRGLFRLFEETLDKYINEINENNIKLRQLGRTDQLPKRLQQVLIKAATLTENNTGMNLSFAINYGGRQEIIDAIRQIRDADIPSQDIDEKLLGNYLYTSGLPDVDLVIRTSGEYRTSNFLIWQTIYSEYYFTDVFWPDFNKEEIEKALLAYDKRQRRLGGV